MPCILYLLATGTSCICLYLQQDPVYASVYLQQVYRVFVKTCINSFSLVSSASAKGVFGVQVLLMLSNLTLMRYYY